MESLGAVVTGCLLLIIGFQTCQGAGQQWSYSGSNDGVNKWAQNYPGQCDGDKQSPIDLPSSVVRYDKDLESFQFTGFDSTNGVTWTLSNNGHTIQVTYASGTLTVNGGSLHGQYQVAQFHFHWGGDSTKGSEHTVNSQAYPMEVHIVCFNSRYGDLGSAVVNPDGLAVLGFFFEISPQNNPTMQHLVDNLMKVKYAGNTTSISPFALTNMMAGVKDYYRYSGGLTTPTCNEVVTWTVFKDTIKISEAQMNVFRGVIDSHNQHLVNNYRPVQDLKSRSIMASWDDEKFAGGSAGLTLNGLALLTSFLLSLSLRL